jgi:hypothetical protein
MSIALACALFLLASLVISRLAFRTLCSPPVMFFAVFLASVLTYLALSSIQLGVLYSSLAPESVTVLILSWFGFFMGSFTVPALKRFRLRTDRPTESDLRFLRQWATLMLVLSVLGQLLVLGFVWRSFGNPLVSAERAREAMGHGQSVGPVTALLFYASFFAIADWTILAVYRRPRYWKIVAVLVAADLVAANGAGSGGWIFYCLVSFGCVYVLCTMHRFGRLPLRRSFVPILGSAMLLVGLTLNAYLRQLETVPLADTIVMHDGMYLGGTIAALDDAIRNPIPSPRPGYNLFPALFRALNMVSRAFLATEQFRLVEINHRFNVGFTGEEGGFFNSAPVMAWIYSELGLYGSTVGCYLIGAFASWVFLTAMSGGELFALEAGAIILCSVVLTFRSSFLDDPYVDFWLMVCLIRELVRRATPEPQRLSV